MPSLSARALASQLGEWRPNGTTPLYEALADRVRLLILDGRISLGTRLPAERLLAEHEELSRTTVAAAYARLRDLGFAESLRGSGTIARLPHGIDDALPALGQPAGPGIIDLSKATLPAIPVVAEAAREAAELLPAHLHESGVDPHGLLVVRRAIADRYTARGLPTTADDIMVTLGAQHAIALIARTLFSRGDRVLIEAPSYPHAVEALRSAGARLVSVPITTDAGWDAESLEQAMPRTAPALAYVMPAFQNPTGRTMPAAQRERLHVLAAAHGTVLLADETMADLGFGLDEQPAPFALGAERHNAQVISVGSVGKSIWGGVRLGWIRADRETLSKLAVARFAGDLGSPVLEQLLLLRLLNSYDRVLDARRDQLRTGHSLMVAELTRRFPHWSVPHVDGGLSVWVNLNAPVSSQLALAARAEGLLIGAGPRFGIDGAFERFVRLPFCHPAEHTLQALDLLELAWNRVVQREPLVASDEVLAAVV